MTARCISLIDKIKCCNTAFAAHAAAMLITAGIKRKDHCGSRLNEGLVEAFVLDRSKRVRPKQTEQLHVSYFLCFSVTMHNRNLWLFL